MKCCNAQEVLQKLIYAYYDKRDIDMALSCLTDSFEWIGTAGQEPITDKEKLRKIMDFDSKSIPSDFEIEFKSLKEFPINDSTSNITFFAKQKENSNFFSDFTIRGFVSCVNSKGGWLVNIVHISIPSTKLDKYSYEKEFEENIRREKALLSGIPGGIAIYRLKKDGKVATDYVSDSLAKMCGYSAEEFLNYLREDSRVNLVKEDIPVVMETVADCMSKNQPIEVRYHIYTKDKKPFLIKLDAKTMDVELKKDDIAVLYAVHTVVSDKTREILNEQERYRSLMSSMDLSLVEIENGKIIYSSEKYSEYLLSEKDLVSVIREKGDLSSIHSADISLFVNMFDRVERGENRTSTVLRLKMKDGSYKWTEFSFFVDKRNSQSIQDGIAIFRDVDEERLKQIENSELLNITPVGILKLVFNKTAVKVLYANNPAIQMFGYDKKDFFNRDDWDFSEVVHPEDMVLISKSLQNPCVGFGYTYDFRLRNKKNDCYHWVACKFLITDVKDGNITTLTNFLDIDVQKRAEDLSAAKSRFLSRMSHEIRTPINAIMGIAELEKQDIIENSVKIEDLKHYSEETLTASKYLLNLVNDILDTSRIENNQMKIQKQVVDVAEYLQSIKTLIAPLIKEKNINFSLERKTHLHEKYIADGVRVKQIIVNLLNNAIKFTPSGGSVWFYCEAISESYENTTLRLTIKDNGIGMSKKFQEHLFNPFVQENSGNTSPFEGTGLGLTISRNLARLMGGDIVCSSVQGKGTTFVATIVVQNLINEAAEVKNKKTLSADIDSLDFSGVNILVCEDHPLNQKITKALLERRKCKVDIASDGVIGVKKFKESAVGFYSMILMDIRMPNMDGLQATKEIRSLKREDALTIPIVAMSANAYDEDVQKSLNAGMNDHLAKPVDVSKLYYSIARNTNRVIAEQPIERDIILVVDDIKINREVIIEALRKDFDVLEAEDGLQALEILKNNKRIIGVVSDIQMPKMNGVELIQQIRQNYKYDNIAILVNTQFGSPDQQNNLLELGADDFVYKPNSSAILLIRLKNVLARRKHVF